jgi:hypothetical protein
VIVQKHIAAALAECRPGPIEIVSICAGDSRDLIAVLADHPRRDDVRAWLLETDPDSLDRGNAAAHEMGLQGQLKFLAADAGRANSYLGMVPVDLVVVVGVLGNQRNAEVPGFLSCLPMLCKTGGSVIWTRSLVANEGAEQVPAIRACLRWIGFEELQFELTIPHGFAVGRARFDGTVLPLDPARFFFEIVDRDLLERPDIRCHLQALRAQLEEKEKEIHLLTAAAEERLRLQQQLDGEVTRLRAELEQVQGHPTRVDQPGRSRWKLFERRRG